MNNEKNEEKNDQRSVEERLERFADSLVECSEINAWEYGNTGNFLFN